MLRYQILTYFRSDSLTEKRGQQNVQKGVLSRELSRSASLVATEKLLKLKDDVKI